MVQYLSVLKKSVKVGNDANTVTLSTTSSGLKFADAQANSTTITPGNALGGGGGGATSYADVSDLPVSASAGDMAYITGTNKLYIYNGTSWFNIAIVNQAPTSITGNAGTYSLAIDGTATVVTLSSTDPEGFPLTWSYSGNPGSIATVTQSNNVFTVTPTSNTSISGEFSLTFSVTDGNNTETSIGNFSLFFASPLWKDVTLNVGTSSTNGLDNSAFIDRSTNALTITPTGTPTQTSFHPYLDNWSVEFDGSGDTLKSPTSADFAFGTGDFTVEFWLLYRGGNGYRFFWNLNPGTDYIGYGLQNGTLTPWLWQDADVAVGNTNVTPNVWQHHAVVRENGVIKIYLDGIEIASGSYTTDIATNKIMCIGGNGANDTQDTNGIYSNFRVVKGTALYTSNFTPPTEKLTAVTGTSLLTCQSNRFIDNSSNDHAITVNGNPVVSADNPFGQDSEYAIEENKGSAYFDGTTNLLSDGIPVPATASFTIEAWIYTTDNTKTAQCILAQYATNNSGRMVFDLPNGAPRAFVGGNSITGSQLNSNEWYHIAWVRIAGSGDYLYVNGVLAGSNSNLGSILQANAWIGDFDLSTGDPKFEGYISDLKVTTGVDVYTSAFTPPTAPVGNTNASLYLSMDNAGIFDKTGNHALTTFGDVTTSNTYTKFADTSIYFDGTGDYIAIPDNTILELGSENFTFECWAYFIGTANWTLFSKGDEYDLVSDTSRFVWQVNGTSNVFVTAHALGSGQWYHIALVRNGATTTLYVNGTSATSGNSVNPTPSSSEFRLGNGNETFNGYIENFQVLKGVAKYTTNFTPPTLTQGRSNQIES